MADNPRQPLLNLGQNAVDNVNNPLFPVNLEATVAMLKPTSIAMFAGISGLNVFTSSVDKPYAPEWLQVILNSLPFTFLPFGAAAICLALCAEKENSLVGCSAGAILIEYMYIVALGGVMTVARSGANMFAVGGVTLTLLVAVVLIWRAMLDYPQCLSRRQLAAAAANGDDDAAAGVGCLGWMTIFNFSKWFINGEAGAENVNEVPNELPAAAGPVNAGAENVHEESPAAALPANPENIV